MSKPCLPIPDVKGYYIKDLVVDHTPGQKGAAGGFSLVGPDFREVRFTWMGTLDGNEWRISGPGAPLPSGMRTPNRDAYPFSTDMMINRGIKKCLISHLAGLGAVTATTLPHATPRREQNGTVSIGHGEEHLSLRVPLGSQPSDKGISTTASSMAGNGQVGVKELSSSELDSKWIPLYKRLTDKQKKVASLLAVLGSGKVEEIARRLNLEPGGVNGICRRLQFFFNTPDHGPALEAFLKKIFERDATLALSVKGSPAERSSAVAASNGDGATVVKALVEDVAEGENGALDLNALEIAYRRLTDRERQVAFLLAEGYDRLAMRERLGVKSSNIANLCFRLRQQFRTDDGGVKTAIARLFAAVPSLRESAQRDIPQQVTGTSNKQLDVTDLAANERSVAVLMGQGLEATQVAAKLNLSVEMIHKIAESLAEKIECAVKELPGRLQAVAATNEAGCSGVAVSAGKEQVVKQTPGESVVPVRSTKELIETLSTVEGMVARSLANERDVSDIAEEMKLSFATVCDIMIAIAKKVGFTQGQLTPFLKTLFEEAQTPVSVEVPSDVPDVRAPTEMSDVTNDGTYSSEDLIFAELKALRRKLPEGYGLTFELSSDPHGTVRATAQISKM